MKAFFDLSTLGPWNRKAHLREWEQLLARLPAGESGLVVASDASSADVVIHIGAPGAFDSSWSSMLRPITRPDIERIVWDWGDAPLGRFSGFYCSLPRRLFDSRRHRTMAYPIIFNEFVDEFPQDDATYDFSFVGGITSGVRTRIFEAFAGECHVHNALVKAQSASWATILDRTDSGIKREYAESLRLAKFVLCPRGAGVGSVRLFETMRAGRVPIIISDGYVAPLGVDWDCCSVTIRESDISHIPEIIASRTEHWSDMAGNARREWADNFSDHALMSYLGRHIGTMRDHMPKPDLRFRLSYTGRVSASLAEQRLRPVVGRLRRPMSALKN